MPGYGVVGPAEGSGLLPWSWAEERLRESQNYWLASVCPDGRPHVMPVWGVWDGDAFWFSSSRRSRKATESAADPVVLEGIAEAINHTDPILDFLARTNAKYGADLTPEFLDPTINTVFRVQPRWAFGLRHDDFTGSPTRWTFPGQTD